ncbi:elongation factor G [Bacillus massiliigorillae]|uniref:elongation factor G n=1 Tax=Bacillus massiliigorillae TaxID=1243664 RepID=UPI00039FDABA|nr:elongation factor G [Bacillus massiliigorillae]
MSKEVRNIVLLGHQGCGKTMTAEALMYISRNTTRLGYIEEGNTISDYGVEEKNRKISIQTSLIPLLYQNYKINILDAPGYLEFESERIQALEAADAAFISVSARSGIKVGTERSFEAAKAKGVPTTFLINKIDKDNSNFERVYNGLREKFGYNVVALQIPVVRDNWVEGVIDLLHGTYSVYDFMKNESVIKDIPSDYEQYYHESLETLMETISESSEEYLVEYLDKGFLTKDEMVVGLKKGINEGEIYPVLCTSAQTGKGIQLLLDYICESMPSPFERTFYYVDSAGNENIGTLSEDESETTALVFKTVADPFVGKLSFVKVLQGSLRVNSNLYNSIKNKEEKINSLYFVRGKEQKAFDVIETGDIGVIAKLQYSNTNDTLCDKSSPIRIIHQSFELPTLERVVVVTKKGDEDKVLSALTKIQEEDPAIIVYRDDEFLELRIIGMGETHLEIIKSKLLNKFDIEMDYKLPNIPYREAIKGRADVQGRYKKQSGGHGQFGDVKIIFEPRTDDCDELLFINKVVGGAVPRNYIPAVEKGLLEAMDTGVLAGFPLIRLQATLYDGSYHAVDSSEYAFKVAASLAYKQGIALANPCILEPIMKVEMEIPSEYIGDVVSELTRKRGRILGMEDDTGIEFVTAEVPQVELLSFTTELKSLTGARGRFTQKFARYEELSHELEEKLIRELELI